jgi:hypothetical protein
VIDPRDGRDRSPIVRVGWPLLLAVLLPPLVLLVIAVLAQAGRV